MKHIISLIIALNTFLVGAFAQNLDSVDYSAKDKKIFNKAIKDLSSSKDKAINELIIDIALYFLETPYVSGTLENNESEQLVINLRETDCILFVEMCLGLAHTIKSEEPTFELYCELIRKMRYTNGTVDGYASRHHYTSGWIDQNEERSLVEEVSKILGRPLNQYFSYMSSNTQSYRQLSRNSDNVTKIMKIEDELNKHEYFYLSKEDIANNQAKIQNGDIVCFVSIVDGLDISHVGYAYWLEDGSLHFIHASSKAKKVVIEEKSLYDYTRYGLRVLRPL